MTRSRIQAVENIEIEAPQGTEQDITWFYCELAGLEQIETGDAAEFRFCYRSGRLEVRVRFVAAPAVDPVVRRLTLRVASLDEVAALLDERGMAYHRMNGLSFTDRCVVTLDPAGHRVELRQAWPEL